MENSAWWRRHRTPRACVKQHRTHKGRSEFFAFVSQQLLTTQTELLVGTGGSFTQTEPLLCWRPRVLRTISLELASPSG